MNLHKARVLDRMNTHFLVCMSAVLCCVVLSNAGTGLVMGRSPVQGVLPDI